MENGKQRPLPGRRKTPETTAAVARAIVREVLRDYPLLTPDQLEAAWHAADPIMRAALAQRRAGEAQVSVRLLAARADNAPSAMTAGARGKAAYVSKAADVQEHVDHVVRGGVLPV